MKPEVNADEIENPITLLLYRTLHAAGKVYYRLREALCIEVVYVPGYLYL